MNPGTVSPGAVRLRLSVLVAGAAIFSLVNSGFDVIGPLWTTRELGFDSAGWAFVRSARFVGTFVGILALGVLAERLGSRRMSSLALGGAGLALAGMAAGGSVLWLIPVYGALASTVFVNFNALTQRVSSPEHQPMANAIYRASSAAAALVAPIVAVQMAVAAGSYAPVVAASALLLGLGAGVILGYPESRGPGSRWSFADTRAAYRRAFTLRPLLVFVGLSQLFAFTVAPVVAFSALRLTRELQLTDSAFGALGTAVGIGSLLVILASGWLMKRLRPSTVLAGAWLGSSLGAMALGLSDSLAVGIGAYALFAPLMAMRSVPSSLWVSRIADAAGADGPGQAMAFTLEKLCQAGTTAAMMAFVGVLARHIPLATLMWWGGLLGLPLAYAALRLGTAQEQAGQVHF